MRRQKLTVQNTAQAWVEFIEAVQRLSAGPSVILTNLNVLKAAIRNKLRKLKSKATSSTHCSSAEIYSFGQEFWQL